MEVGYMEAFMDWNLIYRSAEEFRGLFAGVPGDGYDCEYWSEPSSQIRYGRITRL